MGYAECEARRKGFLERGRGELGSLGECCKLPQLGPGKDLHLVHSVT